MKMILLCLYKIKVLLMYLFGYFFPDKGTYNALLCFKNVFSTNAYIKAREKLFSRVEKKISKKPIKKIRIVMTDCSEWCMTVIYNYFININVDIAVIIIPFFHGTEDSIKKTYELSKTFCEERDLIYYEPYLTDDYIFSYEKWVEAKGDIYLYTNPWMGSYPMEMKVNNMTLSSITYYVPYGFLLMKGEQHQFNQISHNLFSCIFCETKKHLELYGEYCDIGNSHVRFSGYPKMDYYYQERSWEINQIKRLWKGIDDNHSKIRIIYSPHWNFEGGYATFLSNGMKILEYAEKHPDTTSWIYKPHPLLEAELISKGYMSQKDYSSYVDRWKNATNAKIYLQGDYGDIFATSDAIINDSVSFIAEYMYTHKPMLLLQNGYADYNAFGIECVNCIYTCKGDNIDGIIDFINNIKTGRDTMKIKREKFWKTHLDYYSANGTLASDYIVTQISDVIFQNNKTGGEK